jgi:hypothetical protein
LSVITGKNFCGVETTSDLAEVFQGFLRGIPGFLFQVREHSADSAGFREILRLLQVSAWLIPFSFRFNRNTVSHSKETQFLMQNCGEIAI